MPKLPELIFINGPPRSGKDTAGALIKRLHRGETYVTKMSKVLKERTHALYGMDKPHDWFEDRKDDMLDCFLGLTPRQAYISVAERLFKPLHGHDIFGRMVVADIVKNGLGADLVVITDSGFAGETKPLLRAFGRKARLIRMHRPGKHFQDDSRSYISLPGLPTFDIQNDSSLDVLASELWLAVPTMDLVGCSPT